jgi:hypothetical protein
MYSTQSVPDENNENRRVRKEYIQKEMWENYGKSVEEYEAGLIKTLDDVPDDYVVFTKFSNAVKKNEIPQQEEIKKEGGDGDNNQQ